MTHAAALVVALLLDAGMGGRALSWGRLPHPVVAMGNGVAWLDQRLNNGRRANGVAAVLILVAVAGTVGAVLGLVHPVVDIVVATVFLAQRSLVDHVRAVATGLQSGLAEGRDAVAMIVSRDTAQMARPAIARSAIESAAENLSDGVIAPAFWFLVAGLPGILIYKAVNTADSMIGYRTEKYESFGWAAARLDDLLNLIPARLTALMIAAVTGSLRAWPAIAHDARQHRSPNAGWPEAAMARALGVALAGPRSYDGEMRDLAWVNGAGRRETGAYDIRAAIGVLWQTWALATGLTLAIAVLAWLT
ncbi:adenosylcobinamide-phosphate synthase CbiB [Chachezhania antarctica]|uniref:adenosylcobinamide-phosphate synthase CbiB n=1 Tax=Chachezhania antarctica TaxID=2340860 RepID=UPI000EB17145|nr:adenosylcobinamide-phosphate synthase CbiB [Chachezhania antarctica]